MPSARHPKASLVAQRKLFSGLSSFAELERRIALLPDERARGDAFEVFAEGYLATQRKHDVANVWPLAAAPIDLLKKLKLSGPDYGIDGVFRTLIGHHSAYQVKFRAGRPSLTWRELSTFIGLADCPRIQSRVLITNCDGLPSVLNERQGFFCIRGSDLDRLEAEDFRDIVGWLAASAFERPKRKPRPHQTEALRALLPALQAHDCVSAIMACGTGKTLVALWAAERMRASRILVLLPSLALLRQTLHEWLHETSLPFPYLCVCSDPTVKEGADAIATPQSDLDFQVSTDAASVREFLDAPFAGTKVIFSTYQSARVVGEGMKPREAFDLGIFDEAHKTAGREGRNFAFALEDRNLPIRKRLFLTATPRHYNPLRKDKEGDAQLVFSMDKPAVYGPQAFRLTFAEAARRDIICRYKVVISVITSGMVTNELLSHGEVLVKGDAVRARQVANQIALRDAIGKYGMKKVFTFHKDVKSAQSFVSDGPEGIGTHLAPAASVGRGSRRAETTRLITAPPERRPTDEFHTFHVNGTMPTAHRERLMRDFRAAPSAVMSNARCLTEGVDVPAVDMVAFLSPRRSRVDIVQATGRAMRLAPGKTTGYVLVPLYLEQAAGETVEQAVSRSDFDEVWDVLQSLQEQDEVLAEIIREMREERGRTKSFDDSRFRERVDMLGQNIALESLRKSITTTCIERLGTSWDERFGELRAFKKQHGHLNVSARSLQNLQLAAWVDVQRRFKTTGKLGAERIRRLEAIGFIWDPFDAHWEQMFAELVAYKNTHRTCNVPQRWSQNPGLGTWVNKQRRLAKTGELYKNRIHRLEKIGFVWNPVEVRWERMFALLLEYKHRHGDCNVPARWPENSRLAAWVDVQRRFKKTGKLNRERIRRLEEIGFAWDPFEAYWEQMFARLVDFKRQKGDCNVPHAAQDYSELSGWVDRQRQARKKGSLEHERCRRLEEIGFIWSPYEAFWDEMFAALVGYREKHGDCNVTQTYAEDPKLGTWVTNQRRRQRIGKLGLECFRRLEAVGFVWDTLVASWEEMFGALIEYKGKNGDCNVPQGWPESPRLGTWVDVQRRFKKTGKLSGVRIRRLQEIGFQWTRRKQREVIR